MINSIITNTVNDTNTINTNALEFIYNENNALNSRRVITSIEQALEQCIHDGNPDDTVFYFSIAFITKSGLAPLLMALRELSDKGLKGKILTTDYLNFTEPSALHALLHLKNVELKMYRSGSNQGFHTKGYIFNHKNCHEIIIGSSNLTNNAMNSNIEWNVSVKTHSNSYFAKNVLNAFYKLWNDSNAVFYKTIDVQYTQLYKKTCREDKLIAAKYKERQNQKSNFQPNAIQQEFVVKITNSIKNKDKKGLLISATGTGKTFACIFAMKAIMPKRLLFIVHREFIAIQAKASFDLIFKDLRTTSLVAGNTQKDFSGDFVFATFQSLNTIDNSTGKKRYLSVNSTDFDFVVIDECHHIGAPSYKIITDYFESTIFKLGMSATPDRADNFDVYAYFDNNILLDINLSKALDSSYLCPFHYFGISDLSDISDLSEGRLQLDSSELNKFTSDERVKRIIEEAEYFGYEKDRVNGLIFCSRVEEAQALSDKFNKSGYNTKALSGTASQDQRDDAIKKLCLTGKNKDKLHYIFTVDIFNEGVDIKEVNQIIMLRPTQSAIIFVQQLGRGLRLSNNKDHLIVLDFIGNYKNNFLIPVALSSDNSYNKNQLRRFVLQPNTLIHGHCSVNLDRIAKDLVLKSIDNAKVGTINFLKQQYYTFAKKLNSSPRHIDFIQYNDLDPKLFIAARGSLYSFQEQYDSNFKIRLNNTEIKYLEYISKYFINALTLLDVTLLDAICNEQQDLISYLPAHDCPIDNATKQHILNYCNNCFDVLNQRSKFNSLSLLKEENGKITTSDELKQCLANKDFKTIVDDIIDYLHMCFKLKNFNNYESSGFVLYNTYTRSEVAHILNWEVNPPGTNIGGYLHDEKTNTLPVFVNYHKTDDAVPYDDRFIDENTLLWFSKKQRRLSSKDVQTFLKLKENGVKIYLFMCKYRADTIATAKNKGQEFYFLGSIKDISNAQEDTIPDEDKLTNVVKMHLHLLTPVARNIYDYIVNKE